MPTQTRTAAWILCSLLLLVLLLPPGRTLAEEVQQVLVANFPDLQRITGTVSVEGTVRHGVAQPFKEITVTPANPSQIHRLTPGGTLVTDGFTSLVLGLSGHFRTSVSRTATIGVILLPEEEPILRAFEEDGKLNFPLEVKVATAAGPSPYFASIQEKLTIAFPRYRILFYNTSEHSVNVNLHVYLTN